MPDSSPLPDPTPISEAAPSPTPARAGISRRHVTAAAAWSTPGVALALASPAAAASGSSGRIVLTWSSTTTGFGEIDLHVTTAADYPSDDQTVVTITAAGVGASVVYAARPLDPWTAVTIPTGVVLTGTFTPGTRYGARVRFSGDVPVTLTASATTPSSASAATSAISFTDAPFALSWSPAALTAWGPVQLELVTAAGFPNSDTVEITVSTDRPASSSVVFRPVPLDPWTGVHNSSGVVLTGQFTPNTHYGATICVDGDGATITATGELISTRTRVTTTLGYTPDLTSPLVYTTGWTALNRIATDGSVTDLSRDGAGGFLYWPYGVETDAAGTVYVGEDPGSRITTITPDGARATLTSGLPVRKVARSPSGEVFFVSEKSIYRVDDGVPVEIAGPFTDYLFAIAAGIHGEVYVLTSAISGSAMTGTVLRVDRDGTISDFATDIVRPSGLAVSASGAVYISEFSLSRIVIIARDGSRSYLPADIPSIDFREAIAVSRSGDVYIGDYERGGVAKVTANGVQSIYAADVRYIDDIAVWP